MKNKTLAKTLTKKPPQTGQLQSLLRYLAGFFRRHWIGTVLLLVATLVFFWPVVTHVSSYSEGGDAMFNAWTLARDHHCLEMDGCPKYADGNIYYPNKNSMFYSETQLSAGLLTLPLHWINQNPLFAYNIWTVASFFFSGWFMYLLAKRLSGNNELISVFAGLAFEFAPFRMSSVTHLQSLSIFYLPLAVLLIMKFFDSAKKRYLAGLFIVLTLLFYASWYQMIFSLIGITVFLTVLLIAKQINWKKAGYVLVAVGAAAIVTLPLALQYVQFSKTDSATFTLGDQVRLSSSAYDYVLPHNGTIWGRIYYHLQPGSMINTYNLDGFSYAGIVLYVTAFVLLIGGIIVYRRTRNAKEKKTRRMLMVYVTAFFVVAVVGFLISLGPVLKIKGDYTYATVSNGVQIAVPMPWLAVDALVPQLHFIRAIGRASVLALFGLCCLFAFVPMYLGMTKWRLRVRYAIMGALCLLIVFELMPAHRVPVSHAAYSYNLQIPAVYKLVKSDPAIDNLIVLRSDPDYPGAPIPVARTEDVLWAGYHNKNIFNGYSGFTPPHYASDYADFVNLEPNDVPKMQKLGLRYVIVDKQLSHNPQLLTEARQLFPHKVYEDDRYVLFKM
ncbi:MAG TPA: hypothetical protein VLH86_01695 [Patescibacteria group bacterium]|nr:hypothetical protein [Patescibacteria group bacterium]